MWLTAAFSSGGQVCGAKLAKDLHGLAAPDWREGPSKILIFKQFIRNVVRFRQKVNNWLSLMLAWKSSPTVERHFFFHVIPRNCGKQGLYNFSNWIVRIIGLSGREMYRGQTRRGPTPHPRRKSNCN